RGPERVTASLGNSGPKRNPLLRGSTVLPRLGRGLCARVEGGLPNPQPTPKETLIMFSFLFRLIHPRLVRNRAGRLSHAAPLRRPCCRLAVEQLEERTVLSATATIAALGDSLTASYLGTPYGAAGDRNWVQQLQAEGDKHLAIDDVAVPGTTSADLGPQVATVAGLVRSGAVQYATLIVGGADVAAYLPNIFIGNPAPFVTGVLVHV